MSGSENYKNSDSYVFADPFKTKDLIWDAYVAYSELYSRYSMYANKNALNRKHPVIRSGLIRYATKFYYEILPFIDMFDLDENDVKRTKSLFDGFDSSFSNDDFHFLMIFCGQFMVKSGIRSIVKQKDNRPDYIKNYG